MNKEQIYLKTVFCCMACDGEIAPAEVQLATSIWRDFGGNGGSETGGNEISATLDAWTAEIQKIGAQFLENYLRELADAKLGAEEQMRVVELAFKTIEADENIAYAEVKFFKKIRSRLTLDDDAILEKYPDKEDFLLPDLREPNVPDWAEVNFSDIALPNFADFKQPQ